MAAEGEKKLITLKSFDGEEFEVESVTMESQTIRHMIEDDCTDNGITLPNVNSKILSKVIEYCNKHVHTAAAAASKAANPFTDGDVNSAASTNNSVHLLCLRSPSSASDIRAQRRTEVIMMSPLSLSRPPSF